MEKVLDALPAPTWLLVRVDHFAPQGEIEWTSDDLAKITEYWEALVARTKDPTSFMGAVGTKFYVYERCEPRD